MLVRTSVHIDRQWMVGKMVGPVLSQGSICSWRRMKIFSILVVGFLFGWKRRFTNCLLVMKGGIRRLKSSAGIYGIKLEGSFEQPYSNAGIISRNEPVVRGHTTAIEQRVVLKSNDKSNIREDNPVISPSTLLKAKISQSPRTGSVMVLDSFRNLETLSKARGLEQPTITNKVQASGQANNPKILMSTGLSSYPMAQWACHRPHKSRMRRSNLISSAPDHVETHMSAVGIATSDFGARTSSVETDGSLC